MLVRSGVSLSPAPYEDWGSVPVDLCDVVLGEVSRPGKKIVLEKAPRICQRLNGVAGTYSFWTAERGESLFRLIVATITDEQSRSEPIEGSYAKNFQLVRS